MAALPWEMVRYVLSFLPAQTRSFLSFGGCFRLTRWPALQQLHYVELGGVELPALAAVHFPPRLRGLVLHDNGCSHLDTLLPHAGLQLLCLGSLPLYCHPYFTHINAGVPALGGFPQLRALHLSAMGLGDDDGAQLNAGTPAGGGDLPSLRERKMNYEAVEGSKYATAAVAFGASAGKL